MEPKLEHRNTKFQVHIPTTTTLLHVCLVFAIPNVPLYYSVQHIVVVQYSKAWVYYIFELARMLSFLYTSCAFSHYLSI